jgi:DNA repair exonuclease SbcCD ATPase subunit
MNPLHLRLRNFRCYERLDLDFPDGLTSIIGEVHDADEGVDSNGAGKSSIALAVDVALFGPEGRESLTQYQTHGIEGMLVELEFEHRGSRFRVRRALSPKGKASVDFEELGKTTGRWLPDSNPSIKETNEAIEATIGISRATFRASSLLLQGMVAFPELEPRERSDVLGRMLGTDRWERRRKVVLGEKAAAAAELEVLTRQLEQADERLAGLNAMSDERVRAYAVWEAAQADLDDVEKAREDAEAATAILVARFQDLQLVRAGLVTAQARLAPLEEKAEASKQAQKELPGLKTRLVKLDRLAAQADALAETNMARVAALADYRQRMINRTTLEDEAVKLRVKAGLLGDDERCDACGQVLGEHKAEYLSRLYAEVSELENRARDIFIGPEPDHPKDIPIELSEAKIEFGAANERLRILINAVEAMPDLQSLVARREDVAEAERKLAMLPGTDEIVIGAARQAALEIRAKLNQAKQLVQDTAEKATRARVELEQLEKLADETRETRSRRDDLDRELCTLAVLDRAYGRDGLPARYLETVALPHIEASASRTLARLGAGCRVRFNTVREGKTGAVRDELYVEIVWDNGDVQEYRHFSGGEKTRIALAISLALAEFLAGRDRASDLLVVDEPQYLDGAGMEALVEVLRELNQRVPKVMLIAHDPRISEAFDQTIRVVRENGRSGLADGMVSGENPERVRVLISPSETPSAATSKEAMA